MSLAKRFWLHAVVILALLVVTTVVYRERHRMSGERRVSAGMVTAIAQEEPVIPSQSETTWVMPSDPSEAGFPSVAYMLTPRQKPGQPEARGEDRLRVTVHNVLETAMHRHLPEHRFSAADMALLTDALLRVRATHHALNQLDVTVENSEILHPLREQLRAALADFEAIAGFSVAEFTRHVQPHVGIDVETDEDTDVVAERLSDYPAGQ
jgi:hypothetical protein